MENFHLRVKNQNIYILILFEVLLIILILLSIQLKIKTPKVQITTIDNKTIKSILAGELVNFYEPNSNIKITKNISFISAPAEYTINSDALNDRFDYSVIKKNGIFRIITLGDSFTYGSYVNTSSNWTELLEDSLNENNLCDEVNKYEVINLGVEGYDLAYETERYIKRGKKYNPDLVLMLVVDFGRVREYRIQKKGSLAFTQNQIDEYLNNGKYWYEAVALDSQIPLIDKINYQEKYFNKFISIYNGNLLLIDYEKNREYTPTINKLVGLRKNIIKQETAISYKDKELLFPDKHPNTNGHVVLKDEILNMLINNRLLPCTLPEDGK